MIQFKYTAIIWNYHKLPSKSIINSEKNKSWIIHYAKVVTKNYFYKFKKNSHKFFIACYERALLIIPLTFMKSFSEYKFPSQFIDLQIESWTMRFNSQNWFCFQFNHDFVSWTFYREEKNLFVCLETEKFFCIYLGDFFVWFLINFIIVRWHCCVLVIFVFIHMKEKVKRNFCVFTKKKSRVTFENIEREIARQI